MMLRFVIFTDLAAISIRMRGHSTFSIVVSAFPITRHLHPVPHLSPSSRFQRAELPIHWPKKRREKLIISVRWIKAIVILERASKLVLLDPEDSSEHTRQWTTYHATGTTKPPGYLESPRYRVPSEFEETKFALDTLIACCGEDGVYPVDKKMGAVADGREEVVISPAVILFVSSVLRVLGRPHSHSKRERGANQHRMERGKNM